MEPTFLTLDDVLETHAEQVASYGGRNGLRDIGLLQSALAQPETMFDGQFLHADLCEMAAAYLFHIVLNHPSSTETNGSDWKWHCYSWRSTGSRLTHPTKHSSTWYCERPKV